MPLPLGQWKINSNGVEGLLLINALGTDGLVTGSLDILPGPRSNGSDRITGFWDETSQELTFSPVPRIVGGDSPVLPIFYKGYLFSTPATPRLGQDVAWTLAGFFQSLDVNGDIQNLANANARRNIFGWLAQITTIT